MRPVVVRIFLRVVAIFYIAYLALALVLISPALNLLPHRYLQDTYGRELQTGWVLFNPFTLSLDISEARLNDPDGERFIAFSEASIDLSLESLWQHGWVLDAIRVRDLSVALARHAGVEYNFSDLLASAATDTPAESPTSEDGGLPGVTVRDLELHSQAIVVTDQARKNAYSSRWNGLLIRAKNVSTVLEEGQPFSVKVEAEDGGKLQWQGEVSIPLGQSTGRLALSDLNLRKLWEYGEPWLGFELKDGRLLVEAEYHLNWKDALNYRISNGRVGVSGVSIAAKSPAQLADTSVDFNALDINAIAVDSAAQHITVGAVTLDALAVAGWMEGNRISLQDLFTIELPASTEDKDDAATATPWTLTLEQAQLRNSGVRWRSEFTEPQLLEIQPLDASIKNLRWPLSADTSMSLQLSINEQARISASGTLALEAGNGSIDFSLQGLPLTWVNPNLPKALKATITGGEVEIKGQVALQEFAPAMVTLAGNIRDFSARQQEAEIQLTGFDLLRIDGLAVDMLEHNLVLKKLTIDSYTGRLHINEDGSINASKIWQAEVGEQAQEIAEDLTQDKPWTFSLPLIEISNSSIDFMDQSLPIQFRTVIGDLRGEVRNLGSDPATAATVELIGSVDGYAPVTLTGEVTPMATPTNLDLTLVFDGVDMALLSPYSGTYAGYVIERGLLDLNLHYALKNNQLQGDNAVRVEKLKLGEKITSDKAVDLPLELALAILTDANGVIDMAIPVTGDVNNPGFDLSGVITDAIINLLTKAITAPFSLLANLVSTEEDLQRISFPAGSAELAERSKESLTELATALRQRPNLSLTITGSINASADSERLQRNTLEALLLERGLTSADIKARGPEWEVAITDLYSALPARSDTPTAPTPREQYDRVVASISVPDDELTALAGQRAVAVKAYLVNEVGLSAERAVVAQADLKDDDNEFSGVELGIGNP
jgi:hypothetical protein